METVYLGDLPVAKWRKGYTPGTLKMNISASHLGILLEIISTDDSVHVKITPKQARKLRKALKKAEKITKQCDKVLTDER